MGADVCVDMQVRSSADVDKMLDQHHFELRCVDTCVDMCVDMCADMQAHAGESAPRLLRLCA